MLKAPIRTLRTIAAVCLLLAGCVPAAYAQAPTRKSSFRAVHYEITAALLFSQHAISARAIVQFEAKEPSALLELQLHQDLTVQNVALADGRPVHFDRDPKIPMRLMVELPQTVVPGQIFSLTFDYAGPLINDDLSPVRGVRLAYIGDDSAILLRAGRWFPLADYPGGQYTANINLITAENITVVGTGEADPPQKRTILFEQPAQTKPGETKPKPKADAPEKSTVGLLYTFHVKNPEPAGSFIAGPWKPVEGKAGGLEVTLFGPPAAVAEPQLADEFAQSLSNSTAFFSSEFGPLERTHFVVAQLPAGGSLQAYSAPGFLLLSPSNWSSRPDSRPLAQLAAGQWFGNSVTAASSDDVWITDGLSRYAEALYVESMAGREALDLALEDFAVGALMFEQTAPLAHASELRPFTPEYRSIVQNKGAVVFHMLHETLGDQVFAEVLHRFYQKFAGKSARIEDFEEMASRAAIEAAEKQQKPEPNLAPFFTQWLNSTGVPEFKLTYVVVRLRKGFAVRGTIQQELETFNMPVQMKIATEGNPELKTVDVTGTRTDFNVETFGRPKPLGITIDPNNELLKSSPKLRIRALIARGEEDAQRGDLYNAIQEYQRAIDVQRNSSLAHFRLGEAAFFQKNYQAAASAFRESLEGDLEPKWVEVWSHIYIGKIYDLSGLRDRAMNEYSKARETRDNTGGAQDEIAKYSAQPFKLGTGGSHTP
ncbi:MAG TPA: M1 family aminopeptidase [Candidatus Acidoferrales bacterium]|nr:M1 family aminopeptidase [Candidatus Acidoferrales bacterium]